MWDSALDRRELGEAIASRFDGAVTYYDQPKDRQAGKQSRTQFRSTAVLDWATLHPVERLELLTTHDLARQEKQKLELLRNLLTYFHYAASESREEVLRAEINRVRSAADELRDRYRAQYTAPVNNNIAFDEAHTTVINGRHRREVTSASLPDGADAALPEAELGHTALVRSLVAFGGAAFGLEVVG